MDKKNQFFYQSPELETVVALIPNVFCASQTSGGTEGYKGGSTEDWYNGSGNNGVW